MKLIKDTHYTDALAHALELVSPSELFFAEYQAQILANFAQKQEAHTILDMGCGDGTLAFLLSHMLDDTVSITGTDTHGELIAIAQEWYKKPNLLYAQYTEITAKKYDLIYCANVLHHIEKNERRAFIENMMSLLNPQGRLYSIEFNPFNPWQVWQFYTDTEEQGNHMILPCSLKKLLKNYGKTTTSYFRKVYVTVVKKS